MPDTNALIERMEEEQERLYEKIDDLERDLLNISILLDREKAPCFDSNDVHFDSVYLRFAFFIKQQK